MAKNMKKEIVKKMSSGQKWTIGQNDKYASMGSSQKTMRQTFDKARASRKNKSVDTDKND